jgi:EAL domain-containing protein (putative c-di-GMP-specific phosphodiesterase class I)/cellobiose-specific phosphotransferase system component IIC
MVRVWLQNNFIYQLNTGKALLFNNNIVKAIVASSLAIVPFAIIRALLLVCSVISGHLGWATFAHWLEQLQQTLMDFMPILMNAFMALHWAIRNRRSVVHFLTVNLCSLLFISCAISQDRLFFMDISIPVALLSGIVVNALLDLVIGAVDKQPALQTRNAKHIALFLFSIAMISAFAFLAHTLTQYVFDPLSPLIRHTLEQSYPQSFSTGLLYIVLRCIPWLFGIHGYFVFSDIDANFIAEAQANMAAWHAGQASLHILSPEFYNVWCTMGGTGNTLSLLLCILLSKDNSHRHILGPSLPLAIFNINEPLIFGLPIVMNPLLIIPFVLVPAVSYIIAYTATAWHWVPAISETVSWSMPPLVSTWMGTNGSMAAMALNLLIIVVGAMIYAPFIQRWTLSKKNTPDQHLFLQPTNLELIPDHRELNEEKAYLEALEQVYQLQSSGHFILYFQPQVRISDRRIIGMEALIRHQGNDGKITPPYFLDYYDRLHAMADIDFWVMEQAVSYLREYLSEYTGMTLSVNVSPQTLHDPRLFNVISRILSEPLPAGWTLEMEITESQALADPEQVSFILAELKQRGIKIALDDFGAGYSTLNYLTRYPLDKIKLDRSLVQGLAKKGGLQFLNQVTKLCRLTECHVVIEGVETEDELRQILIEGIETEQEMALVRSVGIELAQGFLFWRPLPIDEICRVLEHNAAVK